MRPDRNAMPLLDAIQLLGLKSEDAERLKTAVKNRFGELMLRAHPDKGGDAKTAARLLEARRAVLEDLAGTRRLLEVPKPIEFKVHWATSITQAWYESVFGKDE